MEVHTQLGHGFSEIVYKDDLEFEFSENSIFFEREKEYPVYYKDILLSHKFYADFVVSSTELFFATNTRISTNELEKLQWICFS
jgi:GxxExxY protein